MKHVAPEGMSYSQYELLCSAEGIEVSLDNGQYLHFLVVHANEDTDVLEMLLKALENDYLLDMNNAEQLSYFIDACRDVIGKWHSTYIERLYSIILRKWPDTELGRFVKTLNKAFGYTRVGYFVSADSIKI